jgi:peptide deformylase
MAAEDFLVTAETIGRRTEEFLVNPEKFTIKKEGDPCLRAQSFSLEEAGFGIRDKKITQLAGALELKLVQANGVGIAAPQVGINLKLCVVDLPACLRFGNSTVVKWNGKNLLAADPKSLERLTLLDPKITAASSRIHGQEEGCLSIPIKHRKPVVRPWQVTVNFLDLHGKTHILTVDGFLARCCQHEIDHLRGILYTDYLLRGEDSFPLEKFEEPNAL